MESSLPEDTVNQQVGNAIRSVRKQVRWKPGKAESHLLTRRQYGHLPLTATLSAYEQIIHSIVLDDNAAVYVYRWRNTVIYPTLVDEFENVRWLVMFNLSGMMETAFPPSDVDAYLADPRFVYLGLVREMPG